MATPPSVKSFPGPWADLFEAWEATPLRGGRRVRARLRAGVSPEDPRVVECLAGWPGPWAFVPRRGRSELVLFEADPRRPRWLLHASLAVLTAVSVSLAGSLLSGHDPVLVWTRPGRLWPGLSVDFRAWWAGWPFAAALLAIVGAHEAGHLWAARRHRIAVTPPFFIPFPPYLSVVGTLGAFIRMRAPVLQRRPLLDVGLAGPVAGLVPSLVAAAWGLARSAPWPGAAGDPGAPYVVAFQGVEVGLGGSWLMDALAAWLGPGPGPVLLHPVACAGWFGLFVTALNLLPLGQLDGGHIAYAAAPAAHRVLAGATAAALAALGFRWPGWWVWVALVFVVGRGRLAHPPVFDPETGLGGGRRWAAALAALLLVGTFVPRPVVVT